MSGHGAVQLSAGSLAVVLQGGQGKEAAALFREFQAANARCVWEPRLVRAVSGLSLLGWLQSGVLLVRGLSASLDVLRDAWARRALRAPGGCCIRALGDVSAVCMSPVPQSQFVPLAEVLCCAISDMNSTQVLVTQDSLMEHLISHYPGLAAPSQDILYNALGTLIRERKVYHTGEGYFIVTPQTYFITRDAAPGSTADVPPASITYLVSMESCADLTKQDLLLSGSHCKSCSCFSEHSPQTILGQQSINESRGIKLSRGVRDSKPSVQHQATSTAVDQYKCTKDKCQKKFGISLFWRNTSRKEKSRKDLSNFSAQFPPEEWPVRDEDNLDNIPRDIEHEIIKRINPVLTVDNLMKHTDLMQKAEAQKKYFSKGTSTDIVKSKPRHTVRSSTRKNIKGSKHHKAVKEKSKRDKCLQRLDVGAKGQALVLSSQQTNVTDDLIKYKVAQPDVIYKRQIHNPFEGIAHRENTNRAVKAGDMKRSSSPKDRKHMSGLAECSGAKAVSSSARCASDEGNDNRCNEPLSALASGTDNLREYPSSYPQCSTLRIDEKFMQDKDSSAHYAHMDEGNAVLCDLSKKTSVHSGSALDVNRLDCVPKWIYTNQIRQTPSSLQSVQINMCNTGSSLMHVTRPQNEKSELVSYNNYSVRDLLRYNTFSNSENEGFTDEDQALYQKAADDDDICSSLYLEDDIEENVNICTGLQIQTKKNSLEQLTWLNMKAENCCTSDSSPAKWSTDVALTSQLTCINHQNKSYSHSVLSIKGSQGSSKPNQDLKEFAHQPSAHSHVDPNAGESLPASEAVDGSIFDYCNSSDGNSVPDTSQISVKKHKEKPDTDSEVQSGKMHQNFEHHLKLFNSKSNSMEVKHCERNESRSTTGDSGIESPRTRLSLTPNNSGVVERLKRRTFLHSLELHSVPKNDVLRAANSLIQRTPVLNV